MVSRVAASEGKGAPYLGREWRGGAGMGREERGGGGAGAKEIEEGEQGGRAPRRWWWGWIPFSFLCNPCLAPLFPLFPCGKSLGICALFAAGRRGEAMRASCGYVEE